MTEAQERLHRAVGKALAACVPAGVCPVLLYCEVVEGARSAELYYPAPNGRGLVFKFGSDTLKAEVSRLWSSQKGQAVSARWRAMSFVLDGKEFKAEYTFKEAFDESTDQIGRRERAATTVFGKLAKKIDYSAPELDLDV